jgi:hypothetical protein
MKPTGQETLAAYLDYVAKSLPSVGEVGVLTDEEVVGLSAHAGVRAWLAKKIPPAVPVIVRPAPRARTARPR